MRTGTRISLPRAAELESATGRGSGGTGGTTSISAPTGGDDAREGAERIERGWTAQRRASH